MNRKQRQDLTLSDLATVYGCCGLFDICSDNDLLSLSMQGADPFLDWLGWIASDVCLIRKNFISWIRPEQSGGVCTEGYVSDPCADPNGVEWGECDFTLYDFGRVRRHGPVRDITANAMRYCDKQPRYRLDGTVISDDREYDAKTVAETLLQDIRRYTITGNAATDGLYDGLQQLVTNGYTDSNGRRCAIMDSLVIDWNSNGMAGGNGITWNGNAIANTYNLVDVLQDVFRRIRQRISWSPALASQPLRVGDIVLVMPTFMTRCLLDSYTCWSVCPVATPDTIQQQLQTFEARTFRQQLLGGMFGFGRIFLDGFEIPLIGYDWELITGPTRGDIYLLTGGVGNLKTLNYQYLNMNNVPTSGYPHAASDFMATDGGKFLHWANYDNTCVEQLLEIRPRILSYTPWANARFQNVVCNTPTGPLSPDSCDTSFFPETSFSVAACE